MHNAGIRLNLCDGNDQFGDESNFMCCGHGMQLENFVPLDDVLAPVLVPLVTLRAGFGMTKKRTYEFCDSVEFVV